VDRPERDALRGVVFAKQFPNPAESLRGSFVAEQVLATREHVDWRVIAPVPWVPHALASSLGKAYVRGDGDLEGISVMRPRYPVLPRRGLYSLVAPTVARAARRSFESVLAEHKPDFVHVHALYPSGAALRRLVGPVRLPYVVTIHGSDLYSNLVRPRWEDELRTVVSRAAAVVCVSSSLYRDAIARIGADPKRTTVIPDMYDDSSFTYVHRPQRSAPTRFISVGRLVKVKGHDVLIHSFAAAVRKGLNATLTLVGDGPQRIHLKELADAEGVADRVSLMGAIEPNKLSDALASSDVFVLPSRREGFGVVLIEALATGLPAIATCSGGPEDIIQDGDGILIAPDDEAALARALLEIASAINTFDGQTIATRARDRFSRAAVSLDLVDLYHAVVEERVEEHLRSGVTHA